MLADGPTAAAAAAAATPQPATNGRGAGERAAAQPEHIPSAQLAFQVHTILLESLFLCR